jgi:hypothetical protein
MTGYLSSAATLSAPQLVAARAALEILQAPGGPPPFSIIAGIPTAMGDKRPPDSNEAMQWLMTLFLGPAAVVLAGVLVGMLLRGSGLR